MCETTQPKTTGTDASLAALGLTVAPLRVDDVQEENEKTEGENEKTVPLYKKAWRKWANFYAANSFLIGVVCAILLARAYPPLGADYLQPQITATWIAVIFIFIMAGLGLKTEELKKAFTRVYFNGFVQIFNFLVVSSIVFGFSRFLKSVGALSDTLADGMVVCACLPMTVNMCVVLTKSSGGDEAAAVFNSAFSNMVGVFLSPVLILGYIGVSGNVEMGTVFYKLILRVVLPVFVGQVLRRIAKVKEFVTKYKKHFKKAQEWTLVFIVYTVFCKTFSEERDSNIGDVFIMIGFQFVMLCTVMVLAWFSLKILFRKEPRLRVMGLFGCTHKTVAIGVPLINAIYENDPNVGLYTLPLLIWHPMQLVLGSFLSPRLLKFVGREQERLGTADKDSEELDLTEEHPEQSVDEEAALPDDEAEAAAPNDEEEAALPDDEAEAAAPNDEEEAALPNDEEEATAPNDEEAALPNDETAVNPS